MSKRKSTASDSFLRKRQERTVYESPFLRLSKHENILNVSNDLNFKDEIVKQTVQQYSPVSSTTYANNDKILIEVKGENLYLLPCDSSILIEGTFSHTDDAAAAIKINNNAYMHLFESITYKLNHQIIDEIHKPGIATTIKGLSSFTRADKQSLSGSGWNDEVNATLFKTNTAKAYTFQVSIPLKYILGFAEMYKKIIINAVHELILHRSDDDYGFFNHPNGKVTITKVNWHMPQVEVSDEVKLKLYNQVESGRPIKIAFRQWDLFERQNLPVAGADSWTLRSTTQLEKPRWLLIGFQTDKNKVLEADNSTFDDCNIRSIKANLDKDTYPEESFNCDFKSGQYACVYRDYVEFQKKYYERDQVDPSLSYYNFKECPIFVIDCSKQSEKERAATVFVQLNFESNSTFPANSVAYCLVIHDVFFEYVPISGYINRVVM